MKQSKVYSTKNQNQRLINDLQILRKGGGLTAWKLHKTTTLRNVVANQMGIDAEALTAHQLHAYLLHELEALGESIEARATRNAFAIGMEHSPQNLMQRRLLFSRQIGKHADTVELYENRGIQQIAHRLDSFDTTLPLLQYGRPQSLPSQEQQAGANLTKYNRKVQIARNMLSHGLAELYSMGPRAEEIHRNFGRNESPYLDTNVEWLLLPSPRGPEWYTYKLRYVFRMSKETFRLGLVSSSHDSEILMASGLVDDIIKLNAGTDYDKELVSILLNCGFMVYDNEKGAQQPLQFEELDPVTRRECLSQVWQIDPNGCRILEVHIPANYRRTNTLYEYRWSFDLSVNDEHYAFWYAPGLMYLNTITVDFSHFPDRDKWQFFMLPFLGPISPGALEPTGDLYSLSAGGWIMQGHGIALTWQAKPTKDHAL